jgi:hypothetical protein
MATQTDHNWFRSNNLVTVYDFDPDSANATDVGWVDMRDYGALTVLAIRTIGTGAVDGFKILANTASDGSGTDFEVKSHATATEPDAIADFVVLEASAEEIRSGGEGYRYASAQIELATSTDEMIVVYICSQPRFPHDDLTADIIA